MIESGNRSFGPIFGDIMALKLSDSQFMLLPIKFDDNSIADYQLEDL